MAATRSRPATRPTRPCSSTSAYVAVAGVWDSTCSSASPVVAAGSTAYGGRACISAWISVSGCPAATTCWTASRVTSPNGTPLGSSTTMSLTCWRSGQVLRPRRASRWPARARPAGPAGGRRAGRPGVACRPTAAPARRRSRAARRSGADQISSVGSGPPSRKTGSSTPKNSTATATTRPHQPATSVPVDRCLVSAQNSDSTTRPPSSGRPGSRLNSASRRLEKKSALPSRSTTPPFAGVPHGQPDQGEGQVGRRAADRDDGARRAAGWPRPRTGCGRPRRRRRSGSPAARRPGPGSRAPARGRAPRPAAARRRSRRPRSPGSGSARAGSRCTDGPKVKTTNAATRNQDGDRMTGAPTKVPSLIPPRGVSIAASLGALSERRPTVRAHGRHGALPRDGRRRPGRRTLGRRAAALSPSRASDFMQCPLLYRFRVVDRLPQAPSSAAARGTLVHAVLERLFDLPADQRTLRRGPRAAAAAVGAAAGRRARAGHAVPGGRRRRARRLAARRRAAAHHLVRPGGPDPARAGRARALRRDGAGRRAGAARLRRPARRRRRRPAAGGRLQDRPLAERAVRGQGAVPDAVLRAGAVEAARRGPRDAPAGLPRQRRGGALLPRRARAARPPSARSGPCGRPSPARPRPATGGRPRAGCATGATSSPCARSGAAPRRRCPSTPASWPSTRWRRPRSRRPRSRRRRALARRDRRGDGPRVPHVGAATAADQGDRRDAPRAAPATWAASSAGSPSSRSGASSSSAWLRREALGRRPISRSSQGPGSVERRREVVRVGAVDHEARPPSRRSGHRPSRRPRSAPTRPAAGRRSPR